MIELRQEVDTTCTGQHLRQGLAATKGLSAGQRLIPPIRHVSLAGQHMSHVLPSPPNTQSLSPSLTPTLNPLSHTLHTPPLPPPNPDLEIITTQKQ